MAVRLVHAFETLLQDLVAEEEISPDVATVGAKVVRALPFEVRAPHPLPAAGALVLEWSLGSHLAELEILPDLTLRFVIDIGDLQEEGKLEGLRGRDAGAFFGLVCRHFTW